ncbi:MAG: amidophosphoribosyltransferase [Deltaproteobacteria bacterium]|nr:amidophosphoribosyltransferase [Deltaproteobacteria bacterium]
MCGIFGIYGHPQAAHLTYLGLHALQHRGQESAGITASDGKQLRTWRGMGLVVDVFSEQTLADLSGNSAIGHVRYSTSGDSAWANAQPIAVRYADGQLAVAHNGNLVNEDALRRELEQAGSLFSTNADSEVLVHLFARSRQRTVAERVAEALVRLRGAFSLAFLTEDEMIVARDPYGFRPLALGRLKHDGAEAYVVASETSAFNLVGARYERMLAPGEMAVIDRRGIRSQQVFDRQATRFCIFEHIYFARPDSRLGKDSVYISRRRMGKQLAKEQPADADVVISVPDSGTTAALGYAEELGVPFEMGLVRSHYIGRTFIEPKQSIRNFGVRLKLAPVPEVIAGRSVAVVDDSLVRGTTSRKIVAVLRAAGARAVHLRISAPPTRFPCHYGIDTPTREELIASNKTLEEIRQFVGADTLGYLTLEGALDAVGGDHYCHACFSGDYPVAVGRQRAPSKPLPILPQPTGSPGRDGAEHG